MLITAWSFSSIHEADAPYLSWRYPGCASASAAGAWAESPNSTRYSRTMAASFEINSESQLTPLLWEADLENAALPSMTAPSMAAVISHGTVLHNEAQSAISLSSKCQ